MTFYLFIYFLAPYSCTFHIWRWTKPEGLDDIKGLIWCVFECFFFFCKVKHTVNKTAHWQANDANVRRKCRQSSHWTFQVEPKPFSFFLLGLPVQSWPVWLAAVHHELRLLDPIFSLHHRGLKKSNPRVGRESHKVFFLWRLRPSGLGCSNALAVLYFRAMRRPTV